MRRILHLTLVQQYYRQNALFIFVILMGAFGFLSGREHITLIRHALHQPTVLYVAFFFWALHSLKVTAFGLRALALRENEFLHHLHLFSRGQRILAFFLVLFQLIPLTFLYALCMAVVAWQEQKWGTGIAGILFHLVMCLLGAGLMEMKFTRPDWRLPRFLPRWSLPFPEWSFFPYYLVTRQTVLFFLSKVFSVGLLLIVCVLFPTDDYDVRLLGLGAVLAAFGSTVIFQNWIFYEWRYFDFVRNLPLGIPQRFAKYASVIFLLVLPEWLVLLRNWPWALGWMDLGRVAFLLYGVSLGLYFYQRWDGASDNFKPIVYAAIAFCILVMFQVPLEILAVLSGGGGFVLFRSHYYSEEG